MSVCSIRAILDVASRSLNDDGCQEVAVVLGASAGAPPRQIYLHANAVRCDGAEYLAAGLAQLASRGGTHKLTRLCLHENAIGDRGAHALAEAVRGAGLVSLVRLDLSSNAIGDIGAHALADALLRSSPPLLALEELSLAANRIRVIGCAALLTAADQSVVTCPRRGGTGSWPEPPNG